jgi:CheY-like chemotaxis protein
MIPLWARDEAAAAAAGLPLAEWRARAARDTHRTAQPNSYPMHLVLLNFLDPRVEKEFAQVNKPLLTAIYLCAAALIYIPAAVLIGQEDVPEHLHRAAFEMPSMYIVQDMSEHLYRAAVHFVEFVCLASAAHASSRVRCVLVFLSAVCDRLVGSSPDMLMRVGGKYIAMVHPWLVGSSAGGFSASFSLCGVLAMIGMYHPAPWHVTCAWLIGCVLFWSHEKMTRLVYADALRERDNRALTVLKKSEAELAHLQGNFLYQIGELYPNEPKIQSIVCRAKMWSFSRRAIAQLHAGTYISKPTTVHMPKVFLALGVKVIRCVAEFVEVDEALFLMCAEQAVANGAKYGVGSVRVQQTLGAGFLTTEFISENKHTTAAVPPVHHFFEEGATTQGTGIGLAAVKKVCDHLGGACALESVGFNQTKLVVTLPCRIYQRPAKLVLTATPTCTVIIDDDYFIGCDVGASLTQLAPSMHVVNLGTTPEERQQLCTLTLEAQPQLVICDNNIDEVSGISVAHELRNNGFDGVLVLYTACSAEDKEALETDYIDLFDAIVNKEVGAMNDILSIYARIVELSGIPMELYKSVQSDITLMGLVDETQISATAHKIAGKCSTFPKTRRLVQMATNTKDDPSPVNARALAKAMRQIGFFRAERGSHV